MVGPGKMSHLKDLKEGSEIAAKLNTTTSTNVLSVKWVKHHGTEYKSGLIACVEVVDEMPVLYKIHTIFVKDEQVVLALSGVKTICFDEHYHAFKISLRPSTVKVLNIQDLFYYKPMDVQMTYGPSDTSMYAVPFCHLIQV